jgi:SulP family sulfate permease
LTEETDIVPDDEATRRIGPPILQGIVPIARERLSPDIIAGVTLAALGIPEVMGYTKIAGMPVITGLYTILLPIAVFAVLGSSRHLVVGADSATAAIMAAGMVGLAQVGSHKYVELAGVLAILTAGFLLLARLLRLGFLADFLSRSVLIGFLTGVGIQVAMGQVSGMFGVPGGSTGGPIQEFLETLGQIPSQTSWTTFAVSAGVLGTIVILRLITKKIPGALIAVIGAIALSYALDLQAHGVEVLGAVPSGLPTLAIPSSSAWKEWATLLPTAASIFLVVLAQSAATSRAYAAKYSESFNENLDLVGLSGANLAAGCTGTFVVNGSPTKTQMVDGAGGQSQISQLAAAFVVLCVLLFLTAPLAYMPQAVLSAIVFMIGVELVDLGGMRKVLSWRRDEFVVASITAVVVVVVGVEQAILLAIVLSIVDHLRRGYHPKDSLLMIDERGHISGRPVTTSAGTDIAPGLVIYRFTASLYYANANRFGEEVRTVLEREGGPPRWLCIDAAAIEDVDFSGGQTVLDLRTIMQDRGTRLVFAEVDDDVRAELDRYGVTAAIGTDAYFGSVLEAIEAYEDATRPRAGSE